MDFTGNGLLAVSATICAITIAILAIFSCYKRETAENRKVLKHPCGSGFKHHMHCSKKWTGTTSAAPRRRHLSKWSTVFLNLQAAGSQYRKEKGDLVAGPSKLVGRTPSFVTHISDNEDPTAEHKVTPDEHTAVAEIGTTSTLMTNSACSMPSCANLNAAMNSNMTVSNSNTILETANTGNESDFVDKAEVSVVRKQSPVSAVDNFERAEENGRELVGGDQQGYCLRCRMSGILNPGQSGTSSRRSAPKKAMLEEYKLPEPVMVMVQKFEEKLRFKKEEDDYFVELEPPSKV